MFSVIRATMILQHIEIINREKNGRGVEPNAEQRHESADWATIDCR